MHRGDHQRGYLPHRDYQDSVQLVTFREHDSVPKKVIEGWKDELAELLSSSDQALSSKAERMLRTRIDRYEDAGHGACHLRKDGPARIAEDALLSGHPGDYRLLSWCVMPNHVHVLVKLTSSVPLGKISQKWKGGSSIQINRDLGRNGAFWAPDYHDRAIRDEEHYWNAVAYIHQNPVKAGLVSAPEKWPYSSASRTWDPDG